MVGNAVGNVIKKWAEARRLATPKTAQKKPFVDKDGNIVRGEDGQPIMEETSEPFSVGGSEDENSFKAEVAGAKFEIKTTGKQK